MGKSSATSASSCLKIIACGSNTAAADNDDLLSSPTTTTTTPTQTKPSVDKRGWSFRKKSGRHKILGNQSEATTCADKDIPQIVTAVGDEKPQLPKSTDKLSQGSALVCDGESKTSVDAVASENDCTVACEKPKVSQLLVDSENDSTVACEKPKVSQLLVASDDDTNSTSTQAEMDDTVLAPKSGSFELTADLGVAEESVVSKVEGDQMAEPKGSDSLLASQVDGGASVTLDEPDAIIIQASIRGFLAQEGFVQLKNLVKLQAVIRGHLVRRNAIETLHCIRGIAKVQALVRARSSKSLDQTYKPGEGRFSTEKLLQNSFARQLLESTPKPKYVNIRCDPLSPNSAWGWLERWMSVTPEATPNVDPSAERQDDHQVRSYDSQADVEISSMALLDSPDSRNIVEELAKSPESQEFHDLDSQSSLPTDVETQQLHNLMAEEINDDVNYVRMDANASLIPDPQVKPVSLPDKADAEIQQPKVSMKRSASEELNGEGKKLSCESKKTNDPAFIVDQSKFEGLTFAVDLGRSSTPSHRASGVETDAKICSSLGGGLAKTSDPEVVEVSVPSDPRNLVAGSECGTELSITSTLDSPDRCDLERVQPEPQVEKLETSLDPDSGEGQDCEIIGISCNRVSDLPSQPEEVSGINGVSVSADSGTVGMSSNQISDLSSTTTRQEVLHGINSVSVCSDLGTIGLSSNHISDTDITSETTQQEEVHDNGVSVGPVVAESSPLLEHKSKMKTSEEETNSAHFSSEIDGSSSLMEHKDGINEHDVCIEHGSGEGLQANIRSPEASPRSHMTVAESQGTPSSQVSVKGKRNKIDKSGSYTKHSSRSAERRSAEKRSPSNPNMDSGARSSVENLPKDHKSGKRRNSFGSSKSENADQEPRDSCSQNSLPSYMQATKSAKAKAHSPKSSPDFHDKEVDSKKRHSLPGAGGRQGSPRVQRSTSQAAQSAKVNGSHPPNERKWQR